MKVDYVEPAEELAPEASGLTLPGLVVGSLAKLRHRRATKTAARGVVLVADQGVASATNFLTTIIIGRACLPQELGLYTLGMSLAVIVMMVPKAIIWTPFAAFLPGMSDRDRKRFTGSTLVHQILFGVAAACVISAVGIAAVPLTQTGGFGRVLIVLGPALLLMHLREYVRRNCFARLRSGEALAVDAAVSLLQSLGMLALALSGTLTASRAYLVMGLSCAPVVVAWLVTNRRSIEFCREQVIADFGRNWRFARWLLAGDLVIGVTSAFDPWALSFLHGTSAVAVIAVAKSIFSLANPLILSFQNFFGPHAAHVFAQSGMRKLAPLVIRTTLCATGLSLVFALGVYYFSEDILALLYGSEYQGDGLIVTVFVMAEVAFTITVPVALGLVTVGRADVVLKSNLIVMFTTLTLGLWFIYKFGPIGVGYNGLVTGFGSVLWQCLVFAKITRHE